MSAAMLSTSLKPAAARPAARSTVAKAGTKVLRSAGTKTTTPPPMVLSRMEKIGLLSKLESAGVLSLLEKSGITLEFIEKNKLLSKAESLGAVGLLVDRNTPSTLTLAGIALLLVAGATVVFVPDESAALVAAQTAAAVALCGVAGGAILGGTFVAELQKDKALW